MLHKSIRLWLFLFFIAIATRAQKIQTETLPIEEQTEVIVEEKFAPEVKTVEQALACIERKYSPYDNTGRTFSIIEATGYKMGNGKMYLNIHLSSEKVGGGKLVLKSNNKVLWACNFTAKGDGRKTANAKSLTIYVEQNVAGKKQFFTADGSNHPANIFASILKENNKTVNETWKDGTVKELMFIYSACGCPTHVKYLRQGKNAIQQDKNQVIFPDDIEIAGLIRQLMNSK